MIKMILAAAVITSAGFWGFYNSPRILENTDNNCAAVERLYFRKAAKAHPYPGRPTLLSKLMTEKFLAESNGALLGSVATEDGCFNFYWHSVFNPPTFEKDGKLSSPQETTRQARDKATNAAEPSLATPPQEENASSTQNIAPKPDEPAGLARSEIDALRARLRALWSPPVGVRDPKELIVNVTVKLRRDGRLAAPPFARVNAHSVAALASRDSAIRAVLNGQPFDMLKPEHYDSWKEIELTFDPKDMFRSN